VCHECKVAAEELRPSADANRATTLFLVDSITVKSLTVATSKVPSKGWVVLAGHVGASGKALVQVNRWDGRFNGSFRVELIAYHFLSARYAGVDN
jgi:hypothetical protein